MVNLTFDSRLTAFPEIEKMGTGYPHYFEETVQHTSEELAFILYKIITCLSEEEAAGPSTSSLMEQRNECSEKSRVLLCGRWRELEPCLNSLSRAMNGRTELLERVIVATKNINMLYSEYSTSSKPQLVEWDESVYEEYLIERVKSPTDHFSISLAVDLSPSLRRIERIRKLLEPDGTLIITAETYGWHLAKPDLLSSFTENGGTFIKLTECLHSAALNERRLQLLRPTERRLGLLGPTAFAEATRYSGDKGR